jgi:hypothetical protein
MALFKKLSEEIQKTEVKELAFTLSNKERRLLESDIIFGSLLEELDADLLDEAAKTGIQAETDRMRRAARAVIKKKIGKGEEISAYDAESSQPQVPEKE